MKNQITAEMADTLGFDSPKEMVSMIAKARAVSTAKVEQWFKLDCSKDGLEKIIKGGQQP